jgi:hypothetical protein
MEREYQITEELARHLDKQAAELGYPSGEAYLKALIRFGPIHDHDYVIKRMASMTPEEEAAFDAELLRKTQAACERFQN